MARRKPALKKALIGMGFVGVFICALFAGLVLQEESFSPDPEDPQIIREANWEFEQAQPAASKAEAESSEPAPKTLQGENGERYAAGKILVSCDGVLTEDDVRCALRKNGVEAKDINLLSKSLDENGVLLEVYYEGEEDPAALSDRLRSDNSFMTAEPDCVQTLTEDVSEGEDSGSESGEEGSDDSEDSDDTDDDEEDDALEAATNAMASKAKRFVSSLNKDSEKSYLSAAVDDTYIDSQWALSAVCAKSAWGYAKADGAVTVAVIDSGVDYGHSDLKDNLLLSYAKNTYTGYTGSFAVYDVIGHGTHVAGIISARSNNGAGVSGVSYNANILPIKVTYGVDGSLYASDVIEALDYVVSLKTDTSMPESIQNIRVINLSLGGYTYSSTYEDAIERAYDAGILVVAAAGNDASDEKYYPASYEDAYAVAALKESSSAPGFEVDTSYSNYGPTVDISAPGTSVYSAVPGESYGYKSGTSMAAAMVSGVAALGFAGLDDEVPDYMDTPEWIRSLMDIGVTDLLEAGWDARSGHGAACAQTVAYMATWRPITSATIDAIPNQEYTGEPVMPKPRLTYLGEELVEGVDYELEYSDNVEEGTATVLVRGLGVFFDEVAVTFSIVDIELERIPFPQENEGLIYTGEEQEGVPAGEGYTLDGTASATRAGSYVVTAILKEGYVWEDGSSDDYVIEWSIEPERSVERPAAVDGLVYNGALQDGVALDNTYGESAYVLGGVCQATNAGSYEAEIALAPGYRWVDGENEAVTVSWGIARCFIEVPEGGSFEYASQEISLFEGLVGSSGLLYAWGNNGSGQLGDGTTADKSRPVEVLPDVVASAMGRYHSAAVTSDGSLYTWGRNTSGQLGDGTTTSSAEPVKVLDGVTSVSLGYLHSAAVTSDGSLYTWGDNEYGQLGDGTYEGSSTPVKILDDVVAVSLGYYHSAAVTADGTLYTWGGNGSGQLGNGSTEGSVEPVKVLDGVTSVSLGYLHSAAVTSGGSLYTWGDNEYGQLGNGTNEDALSPSRVLDDAVSVSLGYYHSAAIVADGSLCTWGNNEYGQLGDGAYENTSSPSKVLGDVVSVSFGRYHSAAVTADGSLYTWGASGSGLLGDGTVSYRCKPVKIMDGVASVTLGSDHSSCIVTSAWRNDSYVVSGDVKAKEVGSYVAMVKPGSNFVWADGTTDAKEVEWSITPKVICPDGMVNKDLVYSGLRQAGVQSGDGYSLLGTLTAVDAGEYSATATLWDSSYIWSDGTTGSKEISWSIEPAVLTASYLGEQILQDDEPALEVEVSGFVNGEDSSTASGYVAPYVLVPADMRPGNAYELLPRGGQADNYTFAYVPGVLAFGASALDGAEVSLSFEETVYNGKVQKPQVQVELNGALLVEGVDYEVSYDSGCKRSGVYAVTVSGMGSYEGGQVLTFEIKDAKLADSSVTLSSSAFVYNGSARKPTATVKVGGVSQLKSEYSVTYWNKAKAKQVAVRNVGTYYAKVAAKDAANTTGSVWKKVVVSPKATANLKLTALDNGFKASWTKRTVQVTGYQVAYRQVGKSAWNTKNVTSYKTATKSVTGLKNKKAYQVRVRTYKTVGGVKYYSAWTSIKSVKTR